jgi:methyl-accepting chemotaxis protein
MAEDFVPRDQHRADLAELRLELANTLASLDKRTELIAQDLARRTDLLAQELGALRRAMEGMRTDLRQEIRELRQEMRELRSTTQRQLWTMIGVVTFAVLTGVIKLVFFP